MRNVGTKADNAGDTYSAGFFNSLRTEVENPVTDTGQTLNPEAGPDTDLDMLGKAMAVYGAGADGFQDSGGADAYVLSRSGGLQPWPSYRNGVSAVFKVGTTNTGASTVNVSTLGVKSITNPDGSALVAGILVAGSYVSIRYNLSNDRFEIDAALSVAPDTVVFTVGGSYSKPTGLKYIKVAVYGAGGGGGGSDTSETGGGGASGGKSVKIILASDLAASETITIGAGGTGAAAGGSNNGTDGGTSSFGAHCDATGGSGGSGSNNATANVPGVGSGGDKNYTGLKGAEKGNNFPSRSTGASLGLGDVGSGGTGGASTTATDVGTVGFDGQVEIEENF